MSLWKIHSWSREQARGTVKSPSVREPLEFDAAVALVDDFVVGEEVDVRLDHGSEHPKVLQIWPQRSRLNPAAHAQKPLPEYLSDAIRVFSDKLNNIGPGNTLEVTTASTNLIELAIVKDAQGQREVETTARFLRPNYAQLEWRMQTGSYRLSAYRWRTWLQHNSKTLEGWSLDPETVASSAYVFAIEPLSFAERRVQYIVAEDLTLSASTQPA